MNVHDTFNFLTDALGSVRQLTSSTGAITYARAYDPYGVVTTTSGASTTPYGYTNEYTSQGLVYLRARTYDPTMGRFLTRDTWMGNPHSPMSYNYWMYTNGNPVNKSDPSGLFPESMIWKNLSPYDFIYEAPHDASTLRERWGLFALLRDAQEFDYMRVGMLDLFQLPYPEIWHNQTQQIWTINCETIMVGSKTLRQYYDTEIKKERSPGIWWRDTSAKYYDLFRNFKLTTYVDGGRSIFDWRGSDYPVYHGFSVGTTSFGEANIVVDLDGNFHLSISPRQTSIGLMAGLGYTESYLCTDIYCTAPPLSEITKSIDGICAGGGLVFAGGISISPLCGSSIDPSSWSSSVTYYIGLEVGRGAGATFTFPLSPRLIPTNPRMGWRKYLYEELSGITYSDILTRWTE